MRACWQTGILVWLAAWMVSADEVKLVWHVPGCHYPVLGWRMTVDLHASDWPVDQEVAGFDSRRYNCHYYTRLYVLQTTHPAGVRTWIRHPRHDGLNAALLRGAGLRMLEPGEAARPGDVVVAGRMAPRGEMTYTHSAIVREVDEAGGIRRIRQKFDGSHPVVDVDDVEFRMLYAGMHPYRTEVWTWSGESSLRVASR